MDLDESLKVSSKTFLRSVDSINKDGYMEGAAEGQSASFQPSFDMGYEQGLQFGLNLGYNLATLSAHQQPEISLLDQRSINCQICLNPSSEQNNIINLYNIQQEETEKCYQQKQLKINFS